MRCKAVNKKHDIKTVKLYFDNSTEYYYDIIPMFETVALIFDEDIYIDMKSDFNLRIRAILNSYINECKCISNSILFEIQSEITSLLMDIKNEGYLLNEHTYKQSKNDCLILQKDLLFDSY